MSSKNKILLTATSLALAINMSCGTLDTKEQKTSKPMPKVEKVEHSKTPNYEFKRNYAKFNGKKSVTLDDKNIETNVESDNTKQLREFDQLFAVITNKMNNKEEVTHTELCKIRSLSMKLYANTELMMEETYTNADSLGQIISRTRFSELCDKMKVIENIEKYSLEGEVKCFNEGHITPTLIKLNYDLDKIIPSVEISDLEMCKINDAIINLKLMYEASDNTSQKLYIQELITKSKSKLPKEIQKVDSEEVYENCNVIEPSR